MSQRTTAPVKRKKSRKGFWYAAATTIIVSAMLYFEYVALLYFISTLALAGLLVVVALSDLDAAKQPIASASAPADDAAAIGGNRITSPAAPTVSAASPPRKPVKQSQEGNVS